MKFINHSEGNLFIDEQEIIDPLEDQIQIENHFAGINFSSGLDNGAEEGIEIMKSLSFFTTMSDEYNLLADIYAVKGWDE